LVLIPQHLLFLAFSYVFLDEIEETYDKDPPLTIYQKNLYLDRRVSCNNVVKNTTANTDFGYGRYSNETEGCIVPENTIDRLLDEGKRHAEK
jgi:hypothetical protein